MSSGANCLQIVSSFSLGEMSARAGAVMHGLQEQIKVMSGITAPSLITSDGVMLFSKYDKFDKTAQQKQYPTVADKSEKSSQKYPAVAEEEHSAKLGLKQNGGEANEAAKRAREFVRRRPRLFVQVHRD
nr:MAHS [Macrobiotus sp. 1 JF-2023a]